MYQVSLNGTLCIPHLLLGYQSSSEKDKWTDLWETYALKLAAIGLGHLIDPQYTPTDSETHSKESIWVYGLFLDRMSHPVAQEVIKSHEDEMNILHLWRDICKTMDKIMMIDIKPLDLLDSLTNEENNMVKWHGTQTQFVEMFEDMVNSL
jgi:hypothetical protein